MNLTLVVRGMVFATRVAFFSGVVDADALSSLEDVPVEDGAADEVETVSELRGGTFSASVVSSEVLPPPKNPLSLPIKRKTAINLGQRWKRIKTTHQ